jgi:anti-sigma factor ChrR (cupin superfamily)
LPSARVKLPDHRKMASYAGVVHGFEEGERGAYEIGDFVHMDAKK